MKNTLYATAGALTVLAGIALLTNNPKETHAMAADASNADPLIVHNVYFTLNESTPANRDRLVAACKRYLVDHPGVVYFAVGTVSDLNREVNVRDWDVGLHVVFENLAAHDQYQVSAPHVKFIDENRATWKQVRVFDSDAVSIKPRT